MRNPSLVSGLALVAILGVVALVADLISPVTRGGLQFPPLVPPSVGHPFGTDDLGRDVLHRFVHGARISLAIGVLAALGSSVIGMSIGLSAGYAGGAIDDALMRLTDAVQVAPRFFLALVVAVLFGASFGAIAAIIALLSWPAIARLMRSEVLSVREREFVLAARAIGASHRRIMTRSILPNALGASIVAGSLQVSQAILLESSLSFLGLGDPSAPSWGLMLNNAQRFLQVAWWLSVIPGLGILLASIGFNLAGDGLNDALDPRSRAR